MATDPKPAAATPQVPAPVERPYPIGDLPSLQLVGTGAKASYYSSIAPSDNTNRSRIFNAMTGNVKPLEDVIGQIIDIENVVTMPIEITDKITGECKPALRVVLVQPNGVMFGCVSIGVWDSIKKAAGVFQEPPWDNGLEFKVCSKKAPVGRTFFLERPDEKELAAHQKARKEAEDKAKAAAAGK